MWNKKADEQYGVTARTIGSILALAAIMAFLLFFFKGCEPVASDEACFEQLRVQNYFLTKVTEGAFLKEIPAACIPKEPEVIKEKDPTKVEFAVTNLMKRCREKWGTYRLPLPGAPRVQCVPCFTFQAKNLNEPIRAETITADLKNIYVPSGESLFKYLNGHLVEAFAQNARITPDIRPGKHYSVMLADLSGGWLNDRVGEGVMNQVRKLQGEKTIDESSGFTLVYVEEQEKADQCLTVESWLPSERLYG